MDFRSAGILGEGGAVAKAIGAGGEGFEPRPQQLEFAGAVERALAAKGRLIIEAGTGVGKSFAYLVPAILRCITTSERVVVATNTIALQEQLVKKDVPLLAKTVAEGGWGLDPKTTRALVPALVKGRGNYVSIRRLKMASKRQDHLFPDAASRRSLHVVEDWAMETSDGSLATLPTGHGGVERISVWDRVQSDSDNCMGRKCEHFEDCFYQKSRRLMESANLLICNHAVFFSDLAMRAAGLPGFLPPYQHVILDEAHNAEDAACDHFGLGLTESRVEHFLGVLYQNKTGKGYLSQFGMMAGVSGAADAAIHATHQALDASRAFFDSLLDVARRQDPALLPSGRVVRAGIVENILSPAMKALAARLSSLKELIKNEPDKFELNAYSIRAGAIAFDADVLVNQSRDGYVYWLETGGQFGGSDSEGAAPDQPERVAFPRNFRGRTRIKLACSPIEVGPALREHFWKQDIGIVLTSATLAVKSRRVDIEEDIEGRRGDQRGIEGEENKPRIDPAFAHLADRLGCDQATTLLLGSPFDHSRQAEVYVDLSVPDPRTGKGGLAAYHQQLAARVLHHVRETDGGAFVLFTSFATLRAVADLLEPALHRENLPMLVQGRDGPAGRLVEEFRKDDRSVLLGAASIWQGVDVKGRGLRNVIIVKLPFDPPDRPIVEARGERLRARGKNPFADDALPRAILRFKQGFGRLIRSQTDFGRVVVMDARVVNTAYGRRFLEALPERVRIKQIRAEESPESEVEERHWIPQEE